MSNLLFSNCLYLHRVFTRNSICHAWHDLKKKLWFTLRYIALNSYTNRLNLDSRILCAVSIYNITVLMQSVAFHNGSPSVRNACRRLEPWRLSTTSLHQNSFSTSILFTTMHTSMIVYLSTSVSPCYRSQMYKVFEKKLSRSSRWNALRRQEHQRCPLKPWSNH